MAVPVSDLQVVAPSAIIELFVLELNTLQHGVNDIYRFHAGVNLNANGEVVWAGNSYLRFPVEAEGFEYNGQGQLPRPKIRVSNILGTITALIISLPDGLTGAKVIRIRTLARYLDAVNFPGSVNPYGTPDPTAEFPREIYYIDRKTIETRDVVEFELAAAFDLQGVRAPKRQCIANICQWKYRSAECGYTAAAYFDANDAPVGTAGQDVCGKRLSSCETRFGVISRAGTVTTGSNILTVATTGGILAGEPVRGIGIPAGTTIASVASATTFVLSANSTATSSVSVTGTASATAASMTVTSATGLGVGHTVSGTYMAGQTITGISGTTLTLSTRPYGFSRDGTYDRVEGDDAIKITDTSSIVVGMRVFGSFGIDTTVKSVTAGVRIKINNNPSPLPEDGALVTVYFMPAAPTASTYSFTANAPYAFRNPDKALPFGSFPGVGSYTT
jgi:lambda family phage minor tail protein L